MKSTLKTYWKAKITYDWKEQGPRMNEDGFHISGEEKSQANIAPDVRTTNFQMNAL
jgi:hypothetical protein